MNKTEVSKQVLWAGIIVLFLSLVFNIGQIAKQNALRGSIDRFSYGLSMAQNDQQASAVLDRFMAETGPRYYSSSQAKIRWGWLNPKNWFGGGGDSGNASDPHSSSYQGSGHCNAWTAGGCFDWEQ